MAFLIYSCLLLGGFVINNNTISIYNYYIVLFNVLSIFSLIIYTLYIRYNSIIKFTLDKLSLSNFITTLGNYTYIIINQLIKFISNFIKKIFLNFLFIIYLFIDIVKFIYNLPVMFMIYFVLLLLRVIYLILIFYIPYLTHIIVYNILPDINCMITDLFPFVLTCFNYYNLNEQFVELSNYFDYYNISYNTHINFDTKELIYNINFNFLFDLFNYLYKLFTLDIKYNDLFNNVSLLNFKNYCFIIIDNFYQTLYLFKNLIFNIENLNYNIEFNNFNYSMDNNNNNVLEYINNLMDNNNSDDNKIINNNSDDNKIINNNSDDNRSTNNNNSDDKKIIKSNSDKKIIKSNSDKKIIKSNSDKKYIKYNKNFKSSIYKKNLLSVLGEKLSKSNFKTKKLVTSNLDDIKLTKISNMKDINKGIESNASNYEKIVDFKKLFKLVNTNISKLDEDTGRDVVRSYRGRFLINHKSMNPLYLSDLDRENPERFSLLNNSNRIRPINNPSQNPLHVITPTYDNNDDNNSDTYSLESQLNYYRDMLLKNDLENSLVPNSTRSEIINEINNEILNHLNEIESETSISNVNETSISNVNETSIINVNETPIINKTETPISDNNDIVMYDVNESTLANTISNNNNQDYIDRGEGPSNLALTSTNNNSRISSIPEDIPDTSRDAFIAANYELFYGSEEINMAEVFEISGGSYSNYMGGIDYYGNIHLNADILNDPAFNPVANLVPGVDFVEGYDSFAIYDHDSEFFKNMIENSYKNNTHERLLDYFDSSKKTWYNSENRILTREYLWELIVKKYNINLDEIENPDSEMKEFESDDTNNKRNDKGKGKAI